MSPRLEVAGLHVAYGDVTALDGVSFEADAGVTVVLGRNGAGKTSLCGVLAGALQAQQGVVRWRARDLEDGDRRLFLRRSGWLPQNFEAPGHMKVEDVLLYAAWLKEVPAKLRRARVDAALRSADLTARRRERVSHLSGGMKQRLGIAQSLVNDPDFLILDEPTVGLDPEQRQQFHAVVADVAASRVILLSTHLLEDAMALAASVLVIDRGRVVLRGTLDDLERLGSDAPGERSAKVRAGFVRLLRAEDE